MQTFAHLHQAGVDELLVEFVHLGEHLGARQLTSFRRVIGFHENKDSHTELLFIDSLRFGSEGTGCKHRAHSGSGGAQQWVLQRQSCRGSTVYAAGRSTRLSRA